MVSEFTNKDLEHQKKEIFVKLIKCLLKYNRGL